MGRMDLAALTALISALVIACGSSDVCVPGVTHACICTSGAAGAQTCNDEGTGYGACGCTGLQDASVVTDAANCTSDCLAGVMQCSGMSAIQACVRGSDGCSHWSSVTPCSGTDTCISGACIPMTCHPNCDGMRCGAATSDGCTPSHACGCAVGMACSPANTCCTPENGAAGCDAITSALCRRVIMCCAAMPAGACQSWAYATANCQAHFVASGIDCSSPSRTSVMVCTEGVNACVRDIPLIACSDISIGTVNLPASCN